MTLHTRKDELLDLLRGGAALAVCAGHLRAALFVDWGAVETPTLTWKVFYYLSGLGHEAVIVFFVISGYLVGKSILKASFVWREYLVSRLSRLWTVLLPCLLLTAGLDAITRAVAPELLSGAYADLWHSVPRPGEYSASLSVFLGNLFFLQTIVVPTFGSNGPLWSLAYEFWYYILFPLAVVALSRRMRVVRRIASVGVLALLLVWLPSDLLMGFAVWAIGALAGWLHLRDWPWRSSTLALVACTLPCATLFFLAVSGRAWWSDLSLGLSIALVILLAPQASQMPLRRQVAALAEISYSLYLSHFPVVILIGALLTFEARWQPGGLQLAAYLALLTVVVCIAAAVWWCFERKTPEVRRAVSGLLLRIGGN